MDFGVVGSIPTIHNNTLFIFFCPADDTTCYVKGGGHRVPPAGLLIKQVLGEYSYSFLRRDIALLFVSTRARDSF